MVYIEQLNVFGDFSSANFYCYGADFCFARCCVVFLWLLFRVAGALLPCCCGIVVLVDEVVLMSGIILLSEHIVVVNEFKH